MKEYILFYIFYTNFFIRIIRLLLFFGLSFSIVFLAKNGIFPKWPMFFYGLFLIFETFFRYKISHTYPKIPISQSSKERIFDSCSRIVAIVFLAHTTSDKNIAALLHLPQIRFLLQKLDIASQEIPLLNISTDDLLSYSLEITKYVNGRFITSMDVFISYLLMTEHQSKLLFNKELKSEDVIQVLKFARTEYPNEEHPKKPGVYYKGDGIGEALKTGWTPNTLQFTKNITYQSLKHKPYVIGRNKEFDKLLESLSKPQNNNVLIVGERGSGKDTLLESFAYKSYMGELSSSLNHKRVLELLTGLFVSGATNTSDLETRLQEIIDEVSHSGNVVLFIPNLTDLLGSGSTNVDMSSILMPYLKDGSLAVVTTATSGIYKKVLEEHPIMEAFEIVKLEDIEQHTAIEMVFKKTYEIEEKENVTITYKAIKACVEFSHRFIDDAVLPGSAVRLLEEAAHRVSLASNDTHGKHIKGVIRQNDIVKTIEEKTHVSVAKPQGEEKDILLKLEDKIHERVINQVEGITVIAEAMRRIRTGLASTIKPISFLFLGPTGVGKTETAKALADIYFHGQEHMIRLDMSEYSDEGGIKRLLGAGPGEGEERGELTDKIHENPFSLVLLDEFEKANPRILDLFLQVLEDGRLTDNKGRTVSFVNSIIIATSNAGAEFVREEIKKGVPVDKTFHKRLLDQLQSKNIFRPELLNRFDAVVTFKPLGKEEVTQITKLMLSSLIKKMQEQDIILSFADSVLQKIVLEGTNEEFGARPLKRYIQDNLEDLLAQKMLREEIKRGDRVQIIVNQNNAIEIARASSM